MLLSVVARSPPPSQPDFNLMRPPKMKAVAVTFHKISQPVNSLVKVQGQGTSLLHVIEAPIKIAYL